MRPRASPGGARPRRDDAWRRSARGPVAAARAARWLGALLAAGALALSGAARADDEADLESLLSESVVQGASKVAEKASDAPATTITITSGDMHRYGIRSLDEAIDFLGMGLVTQNPLHSVELGGRGVLLTGDYGDHVLVLVDGHALNEAWDGTAYFEQGLGVPLELIDHIELILGPGSVLYGGNAMFGVINIVTKRQAQMSGLTLVAEGSVSPQQGLNGTITSYAPADFGGSYRLGAGVGTSFHLFGTKAELVGQAELYHQDGPSFEWAKQKGVTDAAGNPATFGGGLPAGTWGGRTTHEYYTNVPTLWTKLTLGDWTISARATLYNRATPYVNSFNQDLSNWDDGRNGEWDRWISADAQYKKHVSERLAVTVHAYADTYDYRQTLYSADGAFCPIATAMPCMSRNLGASRWAGLELQGTYDWFDNDRLTTLVGADVRVRSIQAKDDTYDTMSGTDLGSVGVASVVEVPWAAYLEQRYSPTRFLHLNAGARFDDDPRGGRRVSPRGAVAVEPWSHGVAKLIYAEAFRPPSYYEMFYASNDEVANPSLRSETVRSVEATLEQKFAGQRLLFGAFRTWWSDMIVLGQTTSDANVYQYENASRIDNYGYNARFDGKTGSLAYAAAVTGAYSREFGPDGSVVLPVAPQLYGNARVSYDLRGNLPVLALATTFVGARPADRANDGAFPVYPVAPPSLTLRATVSGDVPHVAGLSYRASFNYVTAKVVPYVAGPNQYEDPTDPTRLPAQLAPVVRMTAFATLTYRLPL